MSPPLLRVGEDTGQSNVTLLATSATLGSVHRQALELKEKNLMGLSDYSSMDSKIVPNAPDGTDISLNLRSTELRLGLPGSLSPESNPDLFLPNTSQFDEKLLFPLHPSKDSEKLSSRKQVVSGNKRGFDDVMYEFSDGKYLAKPDTNAVLSPKPPNLGWKTGSGLENLKAQPPKLKKAADSKIAQERPWNTNEKRLNLDGSAYNNGNAPATKAQVVGWPPIRSFRKNSLASTKNTNEEDGEIASEIFVKVSMDGAPYLRKVDLGTYNAYQELSSALENMFSCTIVGQLGAQSNGVGQLPSDKKFYNILHGSEYVLTYEDKDGDWMLVGDVPWEMFTDMCKKLRIMKRCDAIGLAPRSEEKSRSRS